MQFVRRKWGWYLTLLDRKHFKVKLLRFKKGGACSNQYHNERAELWLFLSGKGNFKIAGENSHTNCFGETYPIGWEEDERMMGAGEFMRVPLGLHHQYTALLPTLVLEIQYGERCVEEDIVRL